MCVDWGKNLTYLEYFLIIIVDYSLVIELKSDFDTLKKMKSHTVFLLYEHDCLAMHKYLRIKIDFGDMSERDEFKFQKRFKYNLSAISENFLSC